MYESYALDVKPENLHMSLTAAHRCVLISIATAAKSVLCLKRLMKTKRKMSLKVLQKSVYKKIIKYNQNALTDGFAPSRYCFNLFLTVA